jgi:Tfp pilus assembly protein PilO
MKKLQFILLLGLFIQLEAYDFDFEQMKEDAERIEASEYSYNFDLQNPKHKYFVVVNALDVATTIYAMENRNTLNEVNYLLPAKPELEELILQKTIVLYSLYHLGLFSEYPEDQWYINTMNVTLTAAVLSNLYHINTNE